MGTYRLQGTTVQDLVYKAVVEVGYRAIDTATVYRNESDIGIALAKIFTTTDIARHDLFITTKLSPKDQGYEKTSKSIENSLQNLGVEYIDLMLIHWPGTAGKKLQDPINRTNRYGSWKALEDAYLSGKLKAIGVSNFDEAHIQDLVDNGDIRILPMVNQFECHPCLPQLSLRNYCRYLRIPKLQESRNVDIGIQVTAYSSLGEGKLLQDVLVEGSNERPAPWANGLNAIVKVHQEKGESVSKAQILLKWALQSSMMVIPKASSEERLRQNFDLFAFELSDGEMKSLNELVKTALDGKEIKFCWDPKDVA